MKKNVPFVYKDKNIILVFSQHLWNYHVPHGYEFYLFIYDWFNDDFTITDNILLMLIPVVVCSTV